MSHIWLRHEYKSNERRAPITPEQVGLLVALGHRVTVESSAYRVFNDQAYESHGAELAAPSSWLHAPKKAFILGIKEQLQEGIHAENLALQHRHIYFAHVFKGQKCAPETMRRFTVGRGTLLDLEYLVDDTGKRVAAFSYSAGFAGAIAAAYIWADKELGKNPPYALPSHQLSRVEFVEEIKAKFNALGRLPHPLVIGANGRSGQGAVDLFCALGIQSVKWGKTETQSGGPFLDILKYDIMCNCVYLAKPVAPFLTTGLLASQSTNRLSVVADVSNELSFNPIFGIANSTTFNDATIRVGNIDIIEIENLPALTPLDSSIEYATQLFPYLLELLNEEMPKNSIWERAALTYYTHHDIPQLAIEAGRELAENFSSDQYGFDVNSIRSSISKLFAKNPLSGTEKLYFVDYLNAGASEVLSSKAHRLFTSLLTRANLDEIYNSTRMNQHHELLKTVYSYSRSVDFDCVKAAGAKENFFEICDCVAEIINCQAGAEEKFAEANKAFHEKLGRNITNVGIQKFFGEIEPLVTPYLHAK